MPHLQIDKLPSSINAHLTPNVELRVTNPINITSSTISVDKGVTISCGNYKVIFDDEVQCIERIKTDDKGNVAIATSQYNDDKSQTLHIFHKGARDATHVNLTELHETHKIGPSGARAGAFFVSVDIGSNYVVQVSDMNITFLGSKSQRLEIEGDTTITLEHIHDKDSPNKATIEGKSVINGVLFNEDTLFDMLTSSKHGCVATTIDNELTFHTDLAGQTPEHNQ